MYAAMTVTVTKAALLASLIFIHACASPPPRSAQYENSIEQRLLTQLRGWQGTPYRLGGNNKKGVDCSGFVQQTFQHRFGIALPRTTKLQSKVGVDVKRNALASGDLLLFKTGWSSRHVGIYLSNDTFIHASKSKGVTRSSLSNSYWKKHFWKAVRVLKN